MPLVETIKGLIERDLLEIKEVVSEDDNSRAVATEWYLNGELVRRDAHVMVLRTQAIGGQQAVMG